MAKTSVKGAARDALREDAKARTQTPGGSAKVASLDSFVNFAQRLGIGADNGISTSSYGFNPITRNRVQLEWMHRGSWLAGVAVDVVGDDMTRAGIDYTTELEPQDIERLNDAATRFAIWPNANETVKWSRLYGGAIAVMLIDGQDMRTPLRLETVGKDQFKGLLVLDRWMAEPSLEDLVTELGPQLGLPKFYRIGTNAPALRNQVVHYSRVAFRMVGVQLPYQQRLTESLWGLSVLERLYDRMIAFDTASTGAAQLVGKAYLRTLKIKGMRDVVAAGGAAMAGMVSYTELMRRYQGIEGITLIDGEDEFTTDTHGAFSGLSDALTEFAQQLSGALQIPLTRLFGQSPKGFSTGDADIRNYYDHIRQRQEIDLHPGLMTVFRAMAQSEGITLPEGFAIGFRPLWQLSDVDKASIAKQATDTVLAAHDQGLVSDQTALQELRAISRTTGVWSNVTTELINSAETEIAPPMPDIDPATGLPTGGEQDDTRGAASGEADAGKLDKSPRIRKQLPAALESGS